MKSTTRISQNWYIHLLYTRKDFNECLKVIEEQLKSCNGQSDYALYIKGDVFEPIVAMLISLIYLTRNPVHSFCSLQP